MAAQQRRMLTAEKSKLTKVDLTTVLRKEGAWSTLPLETRQHLYSLLPALEEGESEHDPEVNPLQTWLRPHLEHELQVWQESLSNGLEVNKWRQEAMQAGRDRMDGKFDQWKEASREEYWGKAGDDENVEPKTECDEEVVEGAKRQVDDGKA